MLEPSTEWLDSLIIELAARELENFYQKQLNTHLLEGLITKGLIEEQGLNPIRRKYFIFFRNETNLAKTYILKHLYNEKLIKQTRERSETLIKLVRQAVIDAQFGDSELNLDPIPPEFHEMTRDYFAAVSRVYDREFCKIAAIFSSDTLRANAEAAAAQEAKNRELMFLEREEPVEEVNSASKRYSMSEAVIATVATAQGGRRYMEDTSVLFHCSHSDKLSFEDIPQLLCLFSLRMASACLRNPKTHTNGSTSSLAFIAQNHVWVNQVGDSSVFLITGDATSGYQCQRLSMLHRPNIPAEYERLVEVNAVVNSARTHLAHRHGALGVTRSFGHYEQYGQWHGLSCLPTISAHSLSGLKNPHILICSDGLTDGCNEAMIERFLNAHGLNIQETPNQLRRLAQRYGSTDNIGACLFKARRGLVGVVNDGHGYSGEGHLTSQFLAAQIPTIFRDVLKNATDYLACFDELYAHVTEGDEVDTIPLEEEEPTVVIDDDEVCEEPRSKRAKTEEPIEVVRMVYLLARSFTFPMYESKEEEDAERERPFRFG